MNPNQLIKRAEYFQSLAGLLKVPGGILEKITNWAVAVYSNRVVLEINKILQGAEHRKQVFEIIDKILDNEKFKQFMDGDEKAILPSKDNSLFNFKIDYFNLEEIDKQVGLYGVYDWVTKPPALEVFIYRYSANNYNFLLATNEYRKGSSLLKNITLDEVMGKLQEGSSKLYAIWREFRDFANSYEKLSKEHMIKLQMLRGKLEKNITFAKISNPTKFRLSYDDMSEYHDMSKYKDKNILFTSIEATFFFNESDGKEHYDGPWTGLWGGGGANQLFVKKIVPSISRLSEKKIDSEIEDIKETIRHELQHASQSIFNMMKGTDDAGIPGSNLRDLNVDQYGRNIVMYCDSCKATKPVGNFSLHQRRKPLHKCKACVSQQLTGLTTDNDTKDSIDPNNQQQGSIKPENSKDVIEHSLRDVEFYTNLTDNISEFKSATRHVPLNARTIFLKAWVGEITFIDFDRQMVQILKKLYRVDNLNQLKQSQEAKLLGDIAIMLNKLEHNNRFFEKIKQQPLKYNKPLKSFIERFQI